MKNDEFGHRTGYGFGYFGEYVISEVNLDEVNDDYYAEMCVFTDQTDYRDVIEWTFDDRILIAVFQHQTLCDLFICYLKQYLEHNDVEDEFRKQLEEWYLSDFPKYKVLKKCEI